VNISEGYTKAMKVFIKKAAQYGAKVVSDKGKHLKFRDSLGHQISAPKTTSDWRAIKNFESELRGRGFVNQQATKKVKDALVKGTKTTVLRSTLPASRKSANQQTTFKQFTQKFQPNVQGPRRSELEVQADNIIRSLRSKPARKKISRAELDGMNIPQKQKDALMRQGLVENKYKVAAQLMRKAGVRNYDDLTRVVNTIKQQVGDKIIQGIRTPKQPTKKGLELQRRMSRAVDKNKDKYPGLFDEQMVVPRSIKKKNPLMTVKTEMEILKQLSNRPAIYHRARTGRAMPPFSEENKHKDAKLLGQYKMLQDPKRPEDPIKKIKKGLV
jgi:hypothetical protein